MPLHLGPPYHYGLRFDCPECSANIEPDLTIEFLEPGLQGQSLKEAYQHRKPPPEVINLLAEPFVCSSQQTPVHPPEIDAVFLVALIQ